MTNTRPVEGIILIFYGFYVPLRKEGGEAQPRNVRIVEMIS